MSHSVVKVTDAQLSDRLLLVVGEDGTVTPDKETVQSYLNSRPEGTEFEVMHVNKINEDDIDVSVETLVYVPNEELAPVSTTSMDKLSRHLLYFRMDHDYTPLTSPKRTSPDKEIELVDELAQTLSMLDGNHSEFEHVVAEVKTPPKVVKRLVTSTPQLKVKAKMIVSTPTSFKLPMRRVKTPTPKPMIKLEDPMEDLEDSEDDEDYIEDFNEDENDSDFELEETRLRPKRSARKRGKSQSMELHKIVKTAKIKTIIAKAATPAVVVKKEVELIKVEAPADKKPLKKEKKPPKPIPDDFALFSTPDIIRRVAGKPELPESPKIIPDNRLKSPPIEPKAKRLSTELKTQQMPVKTDIRRSKDRRDSEEFKKERRASLDVKKFEKFELEIKTEGHVSIQEFHDTSGSNSSHSALDGQLEPLPTTEDIRSIIHGGPSAVLTTGSDLTSAADLQANLNMEPALELDPSLLDNIHSDLIPDDILYQVAQSLVDNTELQNAIDKSIVDGNLVLDTPLQQPIVPENPQNHAIAQDNAVQSVEDARSGTQIVRPDGRIVVIPPIERPTTRSRNKKGPDPKPATKPVMPVNKPPGEEHISGNELDSDSERDEDEDDPDKLWCICNQPHNNRFMICCDTCEEWYHGKCVNVTKAMGQMMEQEGKEWICLYCKDTSLKRPSAAARRIRKASRTSTDSASSQRRSTSVSNSSLTDSKPSASACIVCGKPSRSNSVYCSDTCILKHAQGVEKVVVFERKTGKILSGASAPSAANLERWLHDHPGFEVVRSTTKGQIVKRHTQANPTFTQSKLRLVKNPSNEGVSLAVEKKGVKLGILPHAPKDNRQPPPTILNKHVRKPQITGLKIISKQVSLTTPTKTKIIQALPVSKPQAPATPVRTKTVQTTLKSPIASVSRPNERLALHKVPKPRTPETTSAPAQPKQENIRENVRKTLLEQLTNRLKIAEDLKLSEEQVNNISTEIESQLYKCFGDTSQKYRNKYRSLIFNIKDVKNQTLWRRICEKSVNPYQLVRLSPDDLASQELALWRERETKHQLDMIKKSELELLNCNRQYVFKTHKGEQVFEDGRQKETVDSTEVIAGLGADSTSLDTTDGKSLKEKEKDKKSSKHSRRDRDGSKERERSRERSRDRKSSKDKERRRRSTSRDRHRRSRSRDRSRHDKKRSKSRDRDRHRRSQKSTRHKKENHSTTDKLDKKSKEILEQLVDKQIVPPLEDRLWKHVPQEDIQPAPSLESDSDHEPTSTVTIPTPPQIAETETEDFAKGGASVESSSDSKSSKTEEEICPAKKPQITEIANDSEDLSQSPVEKIQEPIWKGTINMVDVAQISITAHEVSGDCSGLGVDLPHTLDIVGRISPDTVWDYIGKMKCSNSKMISLLRLNATNMEEKMPYIALYSYLSSRNRLGVVKSINKAVKDFYILPLASLKPIPQALLPIAGPGFEESRPPLLLGIIVRDKRKRPLLDPVLSTSKKAKVEILAPTLALPPGTPPPRSYTPPPNRDPRLKTPALPLPVMPKELVEEEEEEEEDEEEEDEEDMDEPYSPEDSDPDNSLPMTLTVPATSTTFLDTGIPTQSFEPFANKFDSIPGLENAAILPSNSYELQRKMAELDQKIAMQKAEIDNMHHDIVSSASTDIGTSALANIALPSNLQQILDSIKTIAAVTDGVPTDSANATGTKELTIPLMLPKISSRTMTGTSARLDASMSSPTIPLNLPRMKSKTVTTNPVPLPVPPPVPLPISLSLPLPVPLPVPLPLQLPLPIPLAIPLMIEPEKPAVSVLSSLSEEDLIRKAAEMLGESDPVKKVSSSPFTPATTSKVMFTPPPPPSLTSVTAVIPPISNPPAKRSKIDFNQPPVPGLEDET